MTERLPNIELRIRVGSTKAPAADAGGSNAKTPVMGEIELCKPLLGLSSILVPTAVGAKESVVDRVHDATVTGHFGAACKG